MPEWTTEVIWWVVGAGVVGLLLGWLFGGLLAPYLGGRVPARDYELALDQKQAIERDLIKIRRNHAAASEELHQLRADHGVTVGELDATQQLLTATRAEAEAARAHASNELEGINASLTNELDAARVRYAELHGNQVRTTNDLDAAQARIDELDEVQQRMEVHMANAQERVSSLEARTGAASDDLFIARARMSEVEGKLALALTALRSASDGLGSAHERLTGERTIVATEHGSEAVDVRSLMPLTTDGAEAGADSEPDLTVAGDALTETAATAVTDELADQA